VHSMLPAGGYFSTLELKVNFVRAVTLATGPIIGEGRVKHIGRTVATAEGDVHDEQGKLIAHATSTCLVFRPEQTASEGEPPHDT
jgi:uncharacterized protein (TIGR00369 family)